jgi:hypothetical protein
MPSLDTIGALATAMKEEIACLEDYIGGQKAFAQALKDRDWRILQTTMDDLEGISRRLASIEEVRAEAESSLRAETECREQGFYRLAFMVCEPERTALTDLYRQLKISAMRAKFENGASGDYAEGNHVLLGAVLEELFPEKKGRIYGRSGHAVVSGHDSLLLNTAL